MKDINLVDVTIHIDNNIDSDTRQDVETSLRAVSGVISVHMPKEKSHLVVVEYDPVATTSFHLLTTVDKLAGHAELIGL